MNFLADENFPGPSVNLLHNNQIDIKSISVSHRGASDEQVIKLVIDENRIILTHDSDYGELIFKIGLKPKAGVIYFRLYDFEPTDPEKILLDLLEEKIPFKERLTVIGEDSIRQRSF